MVDKWENEKHFEVTIRCMAFQHAEYILEALRSFVMQKTTFPFLILIVDDASTDGTSQIIRDFIKEEFSVNDASIAWHTQDEYSDYLYAQHHLNKSCFIISVNLKQNLYREQAQKRSLYEKWVDCAKYVAMCEGDDYWTDSLKLQKQVNYMEAHPECAICFHPVVVHEQYTGGEYPDNLVQVPTITTINDLAKLGNYIHTPSVMYRYNPNINQKMLQLGRVGVGDYLQHLLYAQLGNICKLPDYMAVYRQGVGVWSGNKVPYKTDIQWLIAVAKMSAVIDDAETKKLLDEQIQTYADSILDGIISAQIGANEARQSKAYKLGKTLMKPFNWLKRRK